MPQTPPDSHVGRCKSCGQPALLPETLDLMVVCPRCGTEAKAAELLLLSPPERSSGKSHDPEFVNAPTILAMRSPSGEASEPKSQTPVRAGDRWLATLDRVNRYVGGRRCQLLAVQVAAFGIPLPIVDYYYSSERQVYSVLFGDLLLLWSWLLLFSWITSLRDEAGRWRVSKVGTWLACTLTGAWEVLVEWRHLPNRLRLRAGGTLLLWTGVALIAAQGLLSVFGLLFEPALRRTNPLPLFPWWFGTLGVMVGSGVLAWVARTGRGARSTGSSNSKGARNGNDLPPIVDLSTSPQLDYGSASVRERVLSALAGWSKRRRRHYASRDAYVAALVRQLRVVAPSLGVRREVWLGRTREMGVADLVLGRELLVHVQKGFSQAAAEWSLAQLRTYQLARPQMPKLIIVFDAERGQLFEGAARTSLEQLHQHANSVTVRV